MTAQRFAAMVSAACLLLMGATLLRGPQPTHFIVHVLNVHFVDRESFIADAMAAEGLSSDEAERQYVEFLADLEAFQDEQAELLQSTLREWRIDRVYVEGWTDEAAWVFRLIARALWRRDAADNQGLRSKRLEFGPAAQLFATGRLGEIEPVESQTLFDAANPFDADGEFRGLSTAAQEAREDYIVGRLLEGGPVTLVLLGGAHDLRDNIERLAGGTCEYVRVRSPGYDAISRRYGSE